MCISGPAALFSTKIASVRRRARLGCAITADGKRSKNHAYIELTIRIEDKPGTLAQCCRALAGRDVNIVAFEAFEREGQSLIRMVVDDPATAKKLLTDDRIYYTETEVAPGCASPSLG